MSTATTTTPAGTTIGWIGTGVMGASMCARLIEAGYPAVVTSRTRSRAEALIAQGARWADSPAEVASAADVVFVMVGFPDDVRAVTLGPDGALAGAQPGTLVVDMSTSSPQLAIEIGAAAAGRDSTALDAPVSGGDVGARNGTLSIMVGGPADAYERALPLFGELGKTIVHHGEHGAGQYTKLVNQTLIAGTMVAMSEALLFATAVGLDPARVLDSVSGGAAGSWSLSNLAPRALRGDFSPGFVLDHFVKDMTLALEAARRERLALPGLALAQQIYVAAQAQGYGAEGTHAVIHSMAAMSDRTWQQAAAE